MARKKGSARHARVAPAFTVLAAVLPMLTGMARELRAQDAEASFNAVFTTAVNAASANNYAAAEQAFMQALREAERFGPDNVRVGTTLNGLAQLYASERKFQEAESAGRRAMPIVEKISGRDSIGAAQIQFTFGTIMSGQGRWADAVPFFQKALTIEENLLGPADLKTAAALCMLGDSYRQLKSYKDAETPLRRCADIREADGGLQNAELAEALHGLALTYQGEGKYALADTRFTLAEKIRENTLGITSPLLAQTMEDHAVLLKQMGRDKEAAGLIRISNSIRRARAKDPKKE